MGLTLKRISNSVVARHLVVLDSSNVASVGYSAALRIMEVIYRSSDNLIYAYHNVTPEQFAGACSAPSIGGHIRANFRDNPAHPFDKVHLQ